jgi:hypothetical protein
VKTRLNKFVLAIATAAGFVLAIGVMSGPAFAGTNGVSIVQDSGSATCDPVYSGSPCFGPPNTGLHAGDTTTLTVTVQQDNAELANATTTITWPAGALTFVSNGDASAACTATNHSVACSYTDFAHQYKSDSFTFTVGSNDPGSTVTAHIKTTTRGEGGGCAKAIATLQMAPADVVALSIQSDASSYVVGDNAVVGGTLTDNGQPITGAQPNSITESVYSGDQCSAENLITTSDYGATKTLGTDANGNYSDTWNLNATGMFSFQANYYSVVSPCITVTVTTTAVEKTVVVPQLPNADAFCYGLGADSYAWITPDAFNGFISPPSPGSSAAEHWSYGSMAFVVKGTDPTGVMQNGFKPFCGKGTLTGGVVNNQGENTTAGYPTAIANWGLTVKNPNGDLGVPEWYQVVVPAK